MTLVRWLLSLAVLTALAPLPGRAERNWSAAEIQAIARHGPWPPPAASDPSNRVAGSPSGIELGRHLFGDPRLSGDGSRSCASCHRPDRDFSDGRRRAETLHDGELARRTPSLWNVGYGPWFGWDGAADSLWSQSVRPLLAADEMASSAQHVGRLIREDPALACGYARAFGVPAASRDDDALLVDASKALAAYQATLVSPRTPFDDFRDALLAGDRRAMARYPLSAQRGLKIFVGDAKCSTCHFGPRFTNGEFADIGIPFFKADGSVDRGRLGGLEVLAGSPFSRVGPHSDDGTGEGGTRTRHVQRLHSNFGEFKVPGLRQAANSSAFMHNGHLATLEEVVDHYSDVSPDRLHSDGSPLVRPLGLAPGERVDLVSFLRSLSVPPPAAPAVTPLCH